jgi:AP-3 complex subunit delta-1
MTQLAASSDLEVQERASVLLAFIKFVTKHLDKGENLSNELSTFFDGELNPVAPKAQKKVPVPEGLDLDAWINEPPSESGWNFIQNLGVFVGHYDHQFRTIGFYLRMKLTLLSPIHN